MNDTITKFPEPIARETIEARPPDGVSEATPSWKAGLAIKKGGEYKTHRANLMHALREAPELKGRVALNTLSNVPEVVDDLPWREAGDHSPWADVDTTLCMAWMNGEDIEPVENELFKSVKAVADENKFDPLQDYLINVSGKWDKVERLDTQLLTWLAIEPTPFAKAAVRRWMISAVARAMDPGCKVDTMLVLEGAQGVGKSTALAELASLEWFLDSMARVSKGKDALEQLRGKWIVEVAELDALGMRERTEVKSFLSRRVDNYRAPWDKIAQDYHRRVVFAGTTNETQWLNDPTGGRRFWPVRVTGPIKIEMIKEFRDQLWAEAYLAWSASEQWHLTDAEEALAAVEQERRRSADELEEPIWHYIAEHGLTKVGKKFLLDYMAEKFGHHLKQNNATSNRLRDVFSVLPGKWEQQAGRSDMRDPRAKEGVWVPDDKVRKTEVWICTDPEIRSLLENGRAAEINY